MGTHITRKSIGKAAINGNMGIRSVPHRNPTMSKTRSGRVAQLVERSLSMRKVLGSIPNSSILFASSSIVQLESIIFSFSFIYNVPFNAIIITPTGPVPP